MEIQVIEKTNGRINRVTGTTIKERLRVCAYCRVSTGNEEQLNSYQSQLKYYDEKINSKSEWQFAGIYADEAISGTLDFKRTDFMRMITDGMSGKFDMILTKSISRFARNTLDTLKYVRMLKEKSIAVLFEEENLNTLSGTGEMLLTVLSAMAQQESENISSHVLLGLKMKKDRGELIGYNGCYGYNYDLITKQITINEEQAEVIKYIFERYVDGIGSSTIAKELKAKGIKSPKGNDNWNESTIRGILKNEKYIGDVLMGKTFTIDPISHKRLSNLGEAEKHYIKEHHEPIISKELFDRVQEIRIKRVGTRETGRRSNNYSKKYAFSSKLYCGFCGSLLTRRNWNAKRKDEKAVWQCIKRAKHGKEECPNCKAIPEEIIEECFVQGYRILCNNNKKVVEDFLKKIENILKENTTETVVNKLEKDKEKINKKLANLLELNLEGRINKEQYTLKYDELNTELLKLEQKIQVLLKDTNRNESIKHRLNKFKSLFKDMEIMKNFDKDVFECLIDKVIIGEQLEDGSINPYTIRFICKYGTEINCEDNFTATTINERQNKLQPEMTNTCGSLCVARVKELPVILDFTSFQDTVIFYKRGRFGLEKVQNCEINVKVVLDTPYYMVVC